MEELEFPRKGRAPLCLGPIGSKSLGWWIPRSIQCKMESSTPVLTFVTLSGNAKCHDWLSSNRPCLCTFGLQIKKLSAVNENLKNGMHTALLWALKLAGKDGVASWRFSFIHFFASYFFPPCFKSKVAFNRGQSADTSIWWHRRPCTWISVIFPCISFLLCPAVQHIHCFLHIPHCLECSAWANTVIWQSPSQVVLGGFPLSPPWRKSQSHPSLQLGEAR